jgi:hypothetical protein
MGNDHQPDTGEKARLRTLDQLDGRTLAAKRTRELIGRLEADLGGDLTAAKQELVRRAAMIGAFIEDQEARYLSGEPVEIGPWLSATNNQRRLLETLGLERVAKTVSLKDYLTGKAASQRPPEGDGDAS